MTTLTIDPLPPVRDPAATEYRSWMTTYYCSLAVAVLAAWTPSLLA